MIATIAEKKKFSDRMKIIFIFMIAMIASIAELSFLSDRSYRSDHVETRL